MTQIDTNHTVISIDQGTTSSRAILFDVTGKILHTAQYEFTQIFPHEGWVEHNPEEIWQTTQQAIVELVDFAKENNFLILGAGITNQRETTLVWHKKTGKPIYNAIVWQDRRTADICTRLKKSHDETTITKKTGLLLDPYFSATKVLWILDNVDGARELANNNELAFGTIDSFLIWRLTQGKSHSTDVTNASRTNLFNINTLQWDQELLDIFNIPNSVLPQVKACDAHFGEIELNALGKQKIPILGVAGDQQAAAIGQCCFNAGDIKSTYGTGCFALVNTGSNIVLSKHKLLSTIAYKVQSETHYALEGSIFIAGAAIQWLRDGIKIIESARQSESMALKSDGNSNITVVPAFTGLGAPYWNPKARGAILGLTRNTDQNDLVAATLESCSFQTYDLLESMRKDGVKPKSMKVDGGMINNDWMAQNLSDITRLNIERPQVTETTALGVAYLAMLNLGIYKDTKELQSSWQVQAKFSPGIPVDKQKEKIQRWHAAVDAVQRFSQS